MAQQLAAGTGTSVLGEDRGKAYLNAGGGGPPEADEAAEQGQAGRASGGRQERVRRGGGPHGQSFSHGRDRSEERRVGKECLL